jgi:hypothetical protein
MSSFLAGPELFAAYASATVDDPDLPRASHLRLLPTSALGFPFAPFAVWDIEPNLMPLDVAWFGRGGPLPQPDLDAAGGEATGWLMTPPPGDARLIGVEARFSSGGRLAVLGRTRRSVVAERSAAPHIVGSPSITRVRARGRGRIDELIGYAVTPAGVLERIVGSATFGTLSLPVGDLPWYVHGEGPVPARRRVRVGAPLRWTRADRPDGPFDPLAPPAEADRVGAFRAETDARLAALLGDPTRPPAAVIEQREWPASAVEGRPWQRLSFSLQNALLLQALDPGLARYLGLMAPLERLPEGRPMAWLAAGAFAAPSPGRRVLARRTGRLPVQDDFERRLLVRLVELFPRLRQVAEALTRHGLELRPFVAAALAAPPPDLLPAPDVRLGEAHWRREPAGPSVRFRQSFAVSDAPLATLAALGRLEMNDWRHRHGDNLVMPAGADPAERAPTLFFGFREGKGRAGVGQVTDEDIPADRAIWQYRLALADLFGRFGAPAELLVPVPARPDLPIPAPQTHLALNAAVAGEAPAAAGTLHVSVPVPKVEDLTAGSRPIQTVEARLVAELQTVAAPAGGGTVAFAFALPALLPMEVRRLALEVRFRDAAGGASEPGRSTVDVADPRPPRVARTGRGILWTSRPGPSPEVEVRLTFPAQASTRYRAYLTDASALGIPLVDNGRQRTRTEIAVDGGNLGAAGLDMRDRFRLVTDPPLTAAGPRVSLGERLPRTIETVQFLRIVPIGDRGVEASFSACGLIPIAVPSDRRPAPPRVTVSVDAATGAALVRVEAVGLDLAALRAVEPGLFGDEPAAAARPPEYRVRRAAGPVPQPIYAREVGRGVLSLEGQDASAVFAAAFTDAQPEGLIPFVRYAYWAEVRMPPERRLPVDVQEVPSDIQPVEPRQVQDAAGVFSRPSSPFLVMRVPAEVPVLAPAWLSAETRQEGGQHVVAVGIAGGPQAHPMAIGRYRLRIWTRVQGGEIVAAPGGDVDLVSGSATWSSPPRPGPAPPITVFAALVDPAGRSGSVVSIPSTPS